MPAGLPAELPALLGLPGELPAGPGPRSDRRFRPRGENGGTYRRYVRSGVRFVTATVRHSTVTSPREVGTLL